MSDIVDMQGKKIKTKIKEWELHLTKKEMDDVAKGIAAFMNVMAMEKVQISQDQIMSLMSVMNKFNSSLNGSKYKIIEV